MTNPTFSIGEALKVGWEGMKRNFWLFAGLIIISGIVALLPGMSLMLFSGEYAASGAGGLFIVPRTASSGAQVVTFILQNIIGIGFITLALRILSGQKGEFSDFWKNLNVHTFFSYLIAAIFYGLIALVGFLLLIIPGIIWTLKYQFAPYFVIDKGLGPVEALKASGEATKGVKWQLFGFGIVITLINIAGFLALGIGVLVTAPMSMVAMAHVYRTLAQRT